MLGVACGPSAKAVRHASNATSKHPLLADDVTHLRHLASIDSDFLHRADDGSEANRAKDKAEAIRCTRSAILAQYAEFPPSVHARTLEGGLGRCE